MLGSQETWRDLTNVNSLVFYYLYKGEFNWPYLRLLFRPTLLSFWPCLPQAPLAPPTDVVADSDVIVNCGPWLPTEGSQVVPSSSGPSHIFSL